MGSRGILEIPPVNFDAVDIAIADACLGVEKALNGKVGYINLAIDVSPRCDCANHADIPIVPHLGVFASTDAVAIDMACVDAAKRSAGMPGSAAELMEAHHPGDRKFEAAAATFHSQSEVTSINTGHEIGLGSREYDLVDVEPQPEEMHRFPYDRRASRPRYMEKFQRFMPFPYDRHDGRGFDRHEEVDIDAVKKHYEDLAAGDRLLEQVELDMEELVPADDDDD